MTLKLDMVSKMDRGELEDKFIRMYEENLIIKRYAKKQDDKIKKSVEFCLMFRAVPEFGSGRNPAFFYISG